VNCRFSDEHEAIHHSIKYPGRFMEWIKKTGNKLFSTLKPMKV
jgi:hypothetical protein